MEKEFLIPAGRLSASIKTLKPFVSTEETRYYLNGIFFGLENESHELTMVATDGVKLCRITADVDRQELFDFGTLSVIVPSKALDTILIMLKGINSEFPISLRFSEDEKTMYMDAADEKGEFRLIDGSYPEYQKVIPTQKPKFSIGLGKAQAKECMRAISSHSGKDGLLWEMVDKNSPLVIKSERKLVVVMPIMVKIPGEVGIEIDAPNTQEDDDEQD